MSAIEDARAIRDEAKASRETLLLNTGCDLDYHPACAVCRAGETLFRAATILDELIVHRKLGDES